MSQQTEKSHTVVVGAGIVGVATALWLARAGHRVTLLDKNDPGEGTSHGNAGVLAACALVPVTTPGLISKAPKMLFSSEFPLFMRWSYLPKLAPWLYRYLSFANDKDTQRIAEGLNYIVGDSVEQHQDLAGNTKADEWLVPSEYQFAYRSRAEFDADSYAWNIRSQYGFIPEFIDGPAVHEKEPALSPDINLLAVMKDHGHIRSPGKYVKALAEVFQDLGGTFQKASVKDVELVDDKVNSVVTDQGVIACDSVVLAMGVWSGPIATKLGINVPMESERGYHVIFKNPSQQVSCPTMITSGKFVATPMVDGMRCAGVVEFGGIEAGPSKAPIDFLMRKFKTTFPDVTYSETVEWLGHRPAPTDSLPFVGQIRNTGIYTGFGHQHIGLTGGAKTGRVIAGLISGEQDEAEINAFRPDRFS
ncbi:FAD-binding oxidoreductase [Granulosicoccus sp.]|nr:FAD-binding oxidoreductase [Granulosicoccus sp.]MDB4222699.1 FAD-binding oxidoreductase [Granulosicoccus sp.]